ncbi:hypothetical protein M436DRAFT_56018 [Aureobasidium namibiae CBS 147.97]|uniref:Uncharacterized protein n=1 Tax=Aureobasidium namibiae CBS 147.97 TaxID=1043004 RepID=A0A074WIL1_9PEZI|nr:uncharacterized protein M436DRAFT_56018 [Aureobasidium namibiae CBS 147.97]KEQ69612.1 hypothetical protein M436DRAFT_56018 [Aureobasidium namibiae CBS 147.97]
MATPPSSSGPPPSQDFDHTSSSPLSSPLSLDRSTLPSESHTSNMATSARDASALDTTKSSQRGFPFLSLPPEIRNMIYHYLFAAVRDGTCWRIYADRYGTRLKGLRRTCRLCRSGQTHTTCYAEYEAVKDMFSAFHISGYPTRPALLQTCSTILNEALHPSLASMHISITCYHMAVERRFRELKLLLTSIRYPTEACLSVFTYNYCGDIYGSDDDIRDFSQLINRAGLRVGHLILCVVPHRGYQNLARQLIAILDDLDHKPAKVEWVTDSSPQYENHRVEFNGAAARWLVKLHEAKATSTNARLPLLRDSFPRLFG